MAKLDLKKIDFNKLYLLKMPIQIGIGAALALLIVILAYFVVFSSQLSDLSELENKEASLKTEFESKAIQAANFNSLKTELEQLRKSFAILLKQLPTDTEVPRLIQELNIAATNNNMSMDSLQPQAIISADSIDILPYKIAITGSYEQLANFTKDVGSLSRIITIDNMNLLPVNANDANKASRLTLTATANTYTAAKSNSDDAADATAEQTPPANATEE